MGLGADLLNLRRSKLSSVEALLAGMDRLAEATSDLQIMNRAYALNALGDAVLANVAVHALENDWGDMPQRVSRRTPTATRRRPRRADMVQLYQRRLFA
jgi:hypothetical protein